MCDVVSDRVECHSGYEYAERPVAFWWEEHKLTITNIESDWRTPEQHCFRVIFTYHPGVSHSTAQSYIYYKNTV